MLTVAAISLFWILTGLVVAQGLLVVGFVFALLRARRRDPASPCPKTAVILCLRGADPFLTACLHSLLDQDYPNYDVQVIVDREDDPARAIVDAVMRERQPANLRVTALTQRLDTCSLKCSSLAQAVSSLDESYEVVALVDADTVPHRTWLRELVAPLADPRVGAATGNRWYMPGDHSWGAMVRYEWNAAAVVQMYWYRIAWGGTLAIRTSVFRNSDLLDHWKNAFCEDTMTFRMLKRQGLRLAFVPSLMMINREGCDVPGFATWMQRQLLTARLYHPGWFAVLAHGLGTSLALGATAVGLLVAAVTRQWEAAAWLAGGLAAYTAGMLLLLTPMELSVRRIARMRGEPTAWLGPLGVLRMAAAIPLTQVVYAAMMLSVNFVRNVRWRGVQYRVAGPWQIRLVEYQPYGEQSQPGSATASL